MTFKVTTKKNTLHLAEGRELVTKDNCPINPVYKADGILTTFSSFFLIISMVSFQYTRRPKAGFVD